MSPSSLSPDSEIRSPSCLAYLYTFNIKAITLS